jgi:hypothetical protein
MSNPNLALELGPGQLLAQMTLAGRRASAYTLAQKNLDLEGEVMAGPVVVAAVLFALSCYGR